MPNPSRSSNNILASNVAPQARHRGVSNPHYNTTTLKQSDHTHRTSAMNSGVLTNSFMNPRTVGGNRQSMVFSSKGVASNHRQPVVVSSNGVASNHGQPRVSMNAPIFATTGPSYKSTPSTQSLIDNLKNSSNKRMSIDARASNYDARASTYDARASTYDPRASSYKENDTYDPLAQYVTKNKQDRVVSSNSNLSSSTVSTSFPHSSNRVSNRPMVSLGNGKPSNYVSTSMSGNFFKKEGPHPVIMQKNASAFGQGLNRSVSLASGLQNTVSVGGQSQPYRPQVKANRVAASTLATIHDRSSIVTDTSKIISNTKADRIPKQSETTKRIGTLAEIKAKNLLDSNHTKGLNACTVIYEGQRYPVKLGEDWAEALNRIKGDKGEKTVTQKVIGGNTLEKAKADAKKKFEKAKKDAEEKKESPKKVTEEKKDHLIADAKSVDSEAKNESPKKDAEEKNESPKKDAEEKNEAPKDEAKSVDTKEKNETPKPEQAEASPEKKETPELVVQQIDTDDEGKSISLDDTKKGGE